MYNTNNNPYDTNKRLNWKYSFFFLEFFGDFFILILHMDSSIKSKVCWVFNVNAINFTIIYRLTESNHRKILLLISQRMINLVRGFFVFFFSFLRVRDNSIQQLYAISYHFYFFSIFVFSFVAAVIFIRGKNPFNCTHCNQLAVYLFVYYFLLFFLFVSYLGTTHNGYAPDLDNARVYNVCVEYRVGYNEWYDVYWSCRRWKYDDEHGEDGDDDDNDDDAEQTDCV